MPVLKVTRAGVTTSLIKQTVNLRPPVVIVEPTHRIGNYTVSEAVKSSNNKNAKILQLLKNNEVCNKLVDEACQAVV